MVSYTFCGHDAAAVRVFQQGLLLGAHAEFLLRVTARHFSPRDSVGNLKVEAHGPVAGQCISRSRRRVEALVVGVSALSGGRAMLAGQDNRLDRFEHGATFNRHPWRATRRTWFVELRRPCNNLSRVYHCIARRLTRRVMNRTAPRRARRTIFLFYFCRLRRG